MRLVPMLMAGILLLAALTLPVMGQSDQGRGNGQYRVQAFTELRTTDGTIASLTATPTTDTPGPVVFDVDDGLRFNGRWTNTKHVVMVSVQSATDGSGSGTRTIQGATYTIADWIHLRQDSATAFGTVEATGTFDADAASYIEPGDFTKDSQGTLVLRTYATADPSDGGTSTTVYWIYDASADVYRFDTTDKDFTNGNGETRVYPVGNTLNSDYVFTLGGLSYGVQSVAGAAQSHVPTTRLAWYKTPGAANGHDFEVTVLFDFPAGAPRDQYDFTIEATIHSLK